MKELQREGDDMGESKIFLSAGFDCEPLEAKSPGCGGPATWQESEKQVLTIAQIYRERNLVDACSFNLTPEAARAQPDLYKSLHDEGFYIGLQPNIPGFRFPTYDRKLGLYSADEQRDIIRLCLDDFEDAMGFTTTTYLPCCGSRSDETASILFELGFEVFIQSGPGRYPKDRPDMITVGLFPFPHKASRTHRCLAGDLDLLVIPNTVDVTGKYSRYGWCPGDPRPEAPVCEETHAMYRDIIDSWLELGLAMGVPIIPLKVGGHNTARGAAANIAYLADYCLEAGDRFGLELVPASPLDIRREAERVGIL